MSNPWKQPFEDLREQQSVLSADALSNYASGQMVYDPKTQKMVPKQKVQPSTTPPATTPPSSTTPATTPSTTTTPPSSTSPTTTPPATAPKPTSSATASTAEKIKGGLDVYKSQVASGNVKGAEETGKSTWALANPEMAKREAERQRTRGTSASTNPLMKDMVSKMPAPTTPSPETTSTAFDKGTPVFAGSKPTGAPNLSAAPVTNRTSTAFGEPSLMSKLSTPAKPAAKPQLGSARSRTFGEENSNVIKGFLVREGYVREATAKRWWDDDGDGVGYEKGEVKGKFKKKKKK
jgi:hypothetical protein